MPGRGANETAGKRGRRPVWATMCGLVRDADAAAAKLRTLAEWRKAGALDGVAVCWWRRETAAHPELAALIDAEGFALIELTEPSVKYSGHFIHQSMTLWYALQATQDGAMVLRSRPDLARLDDHVRDRLTEAPERPRPLKGWPDTFVQRMSVSSVFPTSPWYVNDILFAGAKEDILDMAGFDLLPEYVYNWAEAEHFIHSRATRRLFPLLDAYMQIHAPFWHGQPERARDLLKAQLASDTYLDVLATNLHVLNAYYKVGWSRPANIAAEAEKFSSFSLHEILGKETGLPGCHFLAGPGVTAFSGPQPIKALLTGKVSRDATARRFADAVKRTRSYDYVCSYGANPLRPHPAILKLAQDLHAVRFTEHKLRWDPAAGPNRFEIRGSPERVSALSLADSTARLEKEISELRREVQRLQGVQAVAQKG